jgi:hypothetical protein
MKDIMFSWGDNKFSMSSDSASLNYSIGGDAKLVFENTFSKLEAIEILEEVLKIIKEKELKKDWR